MDTLLNAMVVVLIGINTIWTIGKLIAWALKGVEDERNNNSSAEDSDSKRDRR